MSSPCGRFYRFADFASINDLAEMERGKERGLSRAGSLLGEGTSGGVPS